MTACNAEFEIWLVWSDKRLTVPHDKSTLEILLGAGVPIEPGCGTGSCGECATQFIEGSIVHKDSCLSKKDRERLFCPCVSRARGVLSLPF